MNSMFKKKGGPAFKPKIPVSRPRVANSTAPAQSAKSAPSPAPSEPRSDQPAQPSQELEAPLSSIEGPEPAISKPAGPPRTVEGQQIHADTVPETQTLETPPDVFDRGSRDSLRSSSLAALAALATTELSNHLAKAQQEDSLPDRVDSVAQTKPTKSPESAEPIAPTLTTEHAVPSPVAESVVPTVAAEPVIPTVAAEPVITAVAAEPEVSIEPERLPQSDEPRQTSESSLPAPSIRSAPAEQTPQPTPTPIVDEEPQALQLNGEASAPQPEPAPASTKKRKPRAPKKTKDGESASAPAKTKKRQRKPAEAAEREQPPAKQRRSRNNNAKRTTPRKTRSVTPEDAEDQTVDLQKLKMSDLTRDLHIGKKFSRHDELRERERKARMKAKLEKDGLPDEAIDGDENGTPAKDSPASGPAGSSSAPPTAAKPTLSSGPQFRVVDGQIVLDQNSLVMDRHARAAAMQENMETIEENDFTRLITSNSFRTGSKLQGPNLWTADETELFYRALRSFGTDFEMISKMFPGKQRRHIKLKFNREERISPKLIDAALIGGGGPGIGDDTAPMKMMDLDEYKTYTGGEFETIEAIEAEQRKAEETFEAERQRIADEQAEAMRKKREELFADDDNGNNKDGPAENSGRKKKGSKKKGKQANQDFIGEEIILEG